MYENGKQVNRYAAKKRHQDILKKQYTPKEYSSYEEYKEHCIKKFLAHELWFASWTHARYFEEKQSRKDKQRQSGKKEYYEKWWGMNRSQWKKFLKNDAHRSTRQFYRDYCQKVMNFDGEEDDFDSPLQVRASDPWFWD